MATSTERGEIEEAQVALEQFGSDIDYETLAGKWRLVYTSAADVLVVLQLQLNTGLLEVGDIFQAFTADGSVQNEIRLSVPFLLAPARELGPGGLALKVDAKFNKLAPKTIALTFQEARVCDVRISDTVETLVAPAILPRGSLNHQLLLAIKELELRFPLRGAITSIGGPGSSQSSGGGAGAAVGSYLLSYMDEDMLIGRASASGGTFIFQRSDEPFP